ncbi:MAG: hypothetical protein HUJ27_04590 [Rhodobacteraceae bacterium]|nr:hypothetical protein [Paracoccaceae bacterium]
MTKAFTALLAALTVLASCATTEYPLSGEECGPSDPVQTLDAGDCTLPNTGTGTM